MGGGMTKSLKMRAFLICTAVGLFAFTLLVFNMKPTDLVTLCQFYFGFQGLVAGGFFGFRFGEQWAASRKGEVK